MRWSSSSNPASRNCARSCRRSLRARFCGRRSGAAGAATSAWRSRARRSAAICASGCWPKLRRWRPRSHRYQQEQAAIESWLGLIVEAAKLSGDLAIEIAECARLIKGYGDTLKRGNANYRMIEAHVIRPALEGQDRAPRRHRRHRERANRGAGRSGGREPRPLPGRYRAAGGVRGRGGVTRVNVICPY